MKLMASSLIIAKPDLKTEQEFDEFMTKEMLIPLKDVMWQVFFVQDYSQT